MKINIEAYPFYIKVIKDQTGGLTKDLKKAN